MPGIQLKVFILFPFFFHVFYSDYSQILTNILLNV